MRSQTSQSPWMGATTEETKMMKTRQAVEDHWIKQVGEKGVECRALAAAR